VNVREARLEDAEPIADLLAELGYPRPDDTDPKLAAYLDDSSRRVLVAAYGEEIAGAIALCTWPYLERAGSLGRITAFVVRESSRRHGVGRLLLEAAERAAAELGCVDMEVTSRRIRKEAHAFYDALGYEDVCARSARFMRTLG
jgi:GNAT superfamily N-acetyltransferase